MKRTLNKPGDWGRANMLVKYLVRKAIKEKQRRDFLDSLYPHQREILKQMREGTVMSLPRRTGQASMMKLIAAEQATKAFNPLVINPTILTGRITRSEPASGLDQLNAIQRRIRLLRQKEPVKVTAFDEMLERERQEKNRPWKIVPMELDFTKMEQRVLSSMIGHNIPMPIGREPISDHPIWPKGTPIVNGRHEKAGEKGYLCYRTACQRPVAHWYNRSTRKYYCEDCARDLNRVNRDMQYEDGRPLCIPETLDAEDTRGHEAHYLGLSGKGPGL